MSDSGRITAKYMSSAWDIAPVADSEAVSCGASAAYWDFPVSEPKEIWSDTDNSTYIVSVQTKAFRHETFQDGLLLYGGFCRPGGANIHPPGVRPRAILYDDFGCLQAYIPADYLVTVAESADCPVSSQLTLVDPALCFDAHLAALAQSLRNEMASADGFSRMGFDCLMESFVIHLLRRWSTLSDAAIRQASRSRGGLGPLQRNRALEFLKQNFTREISLSEIASVAGLSPYHFTRSFKISFGVPPHVYQSSLRLSHAKRLLSATNLAIAQVAAEVGYQSSQSFARVFFRDTGMSPTEYRLRSDKT